MPSLLAVWNGSNQRVGQPRSRMSKAPCPVSSPLATPPQGRTSAVAVNAAHRMLGRTAPIRLRPAAMLRQVCACVNLRCRARQLHRMTPGAYNEPHDAPWRRPIALAALRWPANGTGCAPCASRIRRQCAGSGRRLGADRRHPRHRQDWAAARVRPPGGVRRRALRRNGNRASAIGRRGTRRTSGRSRGHHAQQYSIGGAEGYSRREAGGQSRLRLDEKNGEAGGRFRTARASGLADHNTCTATSKGP